MLQSHSRLFPVVSPVSSLQAFCVAAVKLLFNDKGKERAGIRLALKIRWKDFNSQFGDVMRKFRQHMAEAEKWRSLANSRRLRTVQMDLEAVGQSINRGRGELKEFAGRLLNADATSPAVRS